MNKLTFYGFLQIFLVAMCSLLSGCATSTEGVVIEPVNSPSATVKSTPTPVPEPLDAPTLTSTPTIEPATPSPIPSATNTSAPRTIKQDCIAFIQDFPGGHSGKIVFEKRGQDTSISLLDLSEGKVIDLPVYGLGVAVSPNRKMFAYQGFFGEEEDIWVELLIFDTDGKQIKSVTGPEYWDRIERWLDDENISLVLGEPIEPGARDRKYPEPVVVLNPFQNSSQRMQSDYPDIDNALFSSPWYPAATTVYHQNLERVIYPNPGDGVVLYAIPEEKTIASIEVFEWYNRPPLWSPDGSKFLIMGENEFYLVSYEGEVKKLTQLNPRFEHRKAASLDYQAKFYSWSPDNQHIAFWLNTLESNQISLAILDTSTGLVTDLCIPPGFAADDFVFTQPAPVWSPDGKSFVTAANYNSANGGNDVILVNIEENTASRIYSNNYPVGWLNP